MPFSVKWPVPQPIRSIMFQVFVAVVIYLLGPDFDGFTGLNIPWKKGLILEWEGSLKLPEKYIIQLP
jgi:hypothetical protein